MCQHMCCVDLLTSSGLDMSSPYLCIVYVTVQLVQEHCGGLQALSVHFHSMNAYFGLYNNSLQFGEEGFGDKTLGFVGCAANGCLDDCTMTRVLLCAGWTWQTVR